MQVQHLQVGGEAFGFRLPVEHQRGRQDHQRGHIQPPGLLFGEQVRQRLRGLAQAHVVGEDAGEVVAHQVLQPGQALELIRAQLGAEAGGCSDGLNALGVAQAGGDLGDARGTAPRQVEVGQARGVQFRQAQIAVGAVEQIDQRAHQRLDARGADAQAAQRLVLEDQRLVVGDVVEPARQPARILREQAGEQRCQWQRLALDLDAGRQAQPAVLALVDVEHELVDVDRVVAEVVGKLHHPAFLAHGRQGVGHEAGPRRFARQAESLGRQHAEARLHRAQRHAGEAGGGQLLRRGALGGLVAGQASAAAIGQGVEEASVPGVDGDRAVAEGEHAEVEFVGAVRRVAAKAHVMHRQGGELQHRSGCTADFDRRLAALGRCGQGRRHVGQRFGDEFGFGLGQRR